MQIVLLNTLQIVVWIVQSIVQITKFNNCSTVQYSFTNRSADDMSRFAVSLPTLIGRSAAAEVEKKCRWEKMISCNRD